MPLSNLVVVNEEELIDIVDQMRTSIPRQVRKAEQVHNERDRILAEAEEEAKRMLGQAQADAEAIVSQDSITAGAETRKETIIRRAEDEAQRMRTEADDYARGTLLALDSQLATLGAEISRVSSTVHNGLEALSSPSSLAPPDEE